MLIAQNLLERISKFRVEDISKRVVDYVQREYLQADYWNLENIHKVDIAAVILARWVEHQIHLFELLTMAQPFKQKIHLIEKAGLELEKQQVMLAQRIIEAERKLKIVALQSESALKKSQEALKEIGEIKE